MKRQTISVIVGTTATFLLAALISRLFVPVVQEPAPIEQPKAIESKRELVGVNSCSTSACHGGVDIGARLSEATTWRALDPHARAYATLLSDASQTIAQQLWHGKTQAHEAPLCLKCHVHSSYEQVRPHFRKQDGVGCESCHGAAGEWLAPHYRPNWKASLGMLDTKSLVGRANVCATCHVGTPDANVDHDLIAAGHPALRFEFATYFANLPPHWDVAKDKRSNSMEVDEYVDFEIRAWAIGQMVSSATAFELTAHRADPVNGKTWPEFAEFDCFACHHDLQAKSWRQSRDYLRHRKPGPMPMSDWYRRLLGVANTAEVNGTAAETAKFDHRDLLKDRSKLALSARETASALRGNAVRRNEVAESHVHLRVLGISRSIETERELREQSWDGLTQDYLAFLALRAVEVDTKDRVEIVDSVLKKILPEIRFSPGYTSPKRLK